jgi:hypothetical protein
MYMSASVMDSESPIPSISSTWADTEVIPQSPLKKINHVSVDNAHIG